MTRALAALALVPAAAGLSAQPVQAQAYQCSLPGRIQPPDPPRPDGPVRRLPITGYSLAASWSPEFCRSGRDPLGMQCSRRQGRFGFVLHGLWPEGRYAPPQWCSLTPRPAPALLRQHLCMTPSARLLEHEWAKHGSCMVRTPQAYFGAAAALWRAIAWPDADRLSRRRGLTVGDLRQEFLLANPDWRAGQLAIGLTRSGWLQEVRRCYGRDFLPADCPRGKRGAPDSASLKIWRGL